MTSDALLLYLAILMVPSGVDPEDAKRLEEGVYRHLSERSWLGKKFTDGERRSIARAARRSFECHPRKFSKEEVDLYLEGLRFRVLIAEPGGPPSPDETWRELAASFRRDEEGAASSFDEKLRWKKRNGEKAASQIRELADHAAAEFCRIYRVNLVDNDTARECVLVYMKQLTGVSYRSVREAFGGWLRARLNNALRLGHYQKLWPDDGQRVKDWSNMEEIRSKVKDATLEEVKLRITSRLMKFAKWHIDQEITFHQVLQLAQKAEALTGKAREREMCFIGSLIVARFFYPALKKIGDI